ncbi:MAG TPA: mannitol dehydrogenase family protein [Burkholderiaceae bacterium]|nr:mannitol dehydrogenase family protein [Burkholderiaceae bacterium]
MNESALSEASRHVSILDDVAGAAASHPLSYETLDRLPAGVNRPPFDPARLRLGIVHLGCGAFHRAHQAVMTQRAIASELRSQGAAAAGTLDWGIAAASLRTPSILQSLKRQDGLYSVLERGPRSTRVEVVGTLRRLLFAPAEPAALRDLLADPAIRMVTLTVTQAGYCIDASTGRLDQHHPDIVSDLRSSGTSTAIGLVVHGLGVRHAAGVPPPVVLSCDNLPGNGRLLRQACIDFAALKDDRLAGWIERHVQFPNSVVDRIVPATMLDDQYDASAALGLDDAVPVVAEPFLQWVIERFDGPRPKWEAAGAEFVSDVAPWEASKLRLLNGGHLAIAYLGILAGHGTVADAVGDPLFADFALRFMLDEQRPTLPPSGHDIDAYAHQLLERWRNTGIQHRLDRIGRDGSGKVPDRLLASLRDNLRAGRPAPCTVLAVAAWIRCVIRRGPAGRGAPLIDTRSERLRRLARKSGGHPGRLIDGLLDLQDVFSDDLRRDVGFRTALLRAIETLDGSGANGATAQALAEVPR